MMEMYMYMCATIMIMYNIYTSKHIAITPIIYTLLVFVLYFASSIDIVDCSFVLSLIMMVRIHDIVYVCIGCSQHSM